MSTAHRRPFFRRRKSCPFSGPNAPKIDYKDTRLLSRYISERGKIVPSRITAVSAARARARDQAGALPRPVALRDPLGLDTSTKGRRKFSAARLAVNRLTANAGQLE